MPAEVLADDDVGGQLAPEGWDLDVRLLEDRPARLVLDLCRAHLPRDLVVGMDARGGPAALERQAGDAGASETTLIVHRRLAWLQLRIARDHPGPIVFCLGLFRGRLGRHGCRSSSHSPLPLSLS